jgi:hypothetical protein
VPDSSSLLQQKLDEQLANGEVWTELEAAAEVLLNAIVA